MNWKLILCLAVVNWLPVYSRDIARLRKLLEVIQRRLSEKSRGVLRQLDQQEQKVTSIEPNDDILPRDEPTAPGHTLIKPTSDTLESAAKYPHKDVSGSLVYGNLDNLGITYGKTSNRIQYSDFRRKNNVLEDLFGKIQEASKPIHGRHPVIIILMKKPSRDQILLESRSDNKHSYHESGENSFAINDENSGAGNDARVMLDMNQESSESDEDYNIFRRRATKHKTRQPYYASEIEVNGTHTSGETDDSSDSEEDSSDYEKNPGNPYTVHKNRYKQNWLWNFAMTGDHMNVNPRGPQFNSLGPTGSDLFFGRKWWYFNQDDYVPFR